MSVPQAMAPQPQRRRFAFLGGGGMQGSLFLLPALLLITALLVLPMIWTIVLSFNSGAGLRFQEEWVGFEHYTRLFTQDRTFLDLDEFPPEGALVNNVIWIVLYTSLCLVLGLAIAVLAARVRYERVIKAIIFLPMAISATAVAIIWLFVYSPDPQQGVLNAFLSAVQGDFDPIAWVARPSTVNYAIILAYVWASVGFSMVVLSAALKGIPVDIIEAARTDGANEWNIFRRIQLPMLSLPIAVVTVWLIINVIKVFDIIYVMTGGGPGTSSRVIAYTMYRETFEGGKGGYGAAVAVVMLVLIIPIMAVNIRRFRTEAVQG
ncbi:MAG: sugar ABC transporter permease [Actinobacteria bacterium]|nr:sugar ABC transporter permease [Actinomycetota bacterium]